MDFLYLLPQMNQLARECTQDRYRSGSDLDETTSRGSKDDYMPSATEPLHRSSHSKYRQRKLKANG